MSSAAGFELAPIPVAWLKRDLLLFANSIGVTKDELHFLYVPPPLKLMLEHSDAYAMA